MNPTDEQISAWIDGTLPKEDAARMAEAIAADSNLEDRIEAMRNIDRLVRMAVPADTVLPPELMAKLGVKQIAGEDKVVPFPVRTRVAAASVHPGRETSSWLSGWKVAAQVALVGFLGIAAVLWLMPSYGSPDKEYRTLSAASATNPATPTAIVMFDETVSANQARSIAQTVGGEIVGERNAAGAWPMAFDPQKRDEALGKLRQRDDVVLAEPVDGG